MLLQIKNLHFWMQSKMGQRGAALVEYAILLAFVAIVGTAFVSADGNTASIATSAKSIVDKIRTLLSDAANPT